MTSSRPYLIRALYEWILDNGGIPHLLVNAQGSSVNVPREFVEEGRIILDLSPEAVRELIIGNDIIEFRGRFSEAVRHVNLPIDSVLAIYNEEGVGMFFEETEFEDGTEGSGDNGLELPIPYPTPSENTQKARKHKKPPSYLKIVK